MCGGKLFCMLHSYQFYIAAPWSVTFQVSNKFLYFLGLFITSYSVVPDVATKTVCPDYFYKPTGIGYGYGEGFGNTFSYKLPGRTALCGSEGALLIHMIPGIIYKLILINNTKSPTNLHTHGLHIYVNGYSDDVFRQVDPGMCLQYIWAIDEVCSCGTCVSLCFRWGCKSNLTSFLISFLTLFSSLHRLSQHHMAGVHWYHHISITIHLKQ